MARLGIIDWGIGGISIYKLVRERLGEVPVTYFSDTGATPYGKMSRRELVARLNAVIGYMKSRGVTHLVIGCNAASTAIPYLDPQGLIVEGVIDAAVDLAAKIKPSRLGLIGGRRTVVSGVYRTALADRGIDIEQRIAQPLSALIESGDTGSETLRTEAKRILGPIRHCSHIMMACTHYPAIAPLLQELVSSSTELIDPAPELLMRIRRWDLSASGADEFYTSGDAKGMKLSAARAFAVKIDDIRPALK